VDLDSVHEIHAHGRELVLKGAVFGWDPRPEMMEAAERRYALPVGWHWRGQPEGDWAQDSDGTLCTVRPGDVHGFMDSQAATGRPA
jgi:hypothetical protein